MKKIGLILTLLSTIFAGQEVLATTATPIANLKVGHYYRIRSGQNRYMCLVKDESTGGIATNAGTGKIQPVVLLDKEKAMSAPGSIFKIDSYNASTKMMTLSSQGTTINSALDGLLVGSDNPVSRTVGLITVTAYSARWQTNDHFFVKPQSTSAGETKAFIETEVEVSAIVYSQSSVGRVQDEWKSGWTDNFLEIATSTATGPTVTWYFEEVCPENISDNALNAAYENRTYKGDYQYPTNTSGGKQSGSHSSQYIASDMVSKTEDGNTWYYSTMYVPFPVEVPSNVFCYFVKSNDDAVQIQFDPLMRERRNGPQVNIIPANTPFLFCSTASSASGVKFLPVADDDVVWDKGATKANGNISSATPKSINNLKNATSTPLVVNTASNNGLYSSGGIFSSGVTRYKLGNSGGDVKFTTKLGSSDMTDGNRAYNGETSKPVELPTPTPVELVDLIKGNYTVNDYVSIKDDIVIGYVNENAGIVYAHDLANNKDYADLQPITETPENYYNFAPNNTLLTPADYLQSNWVAINVPSDIEKFRQGRIIPGESLTGAIQNDKLNPIFNYMAAPESMPEQASSEYTAHNTYCIANLMAGDDHLVKAADGTDFFFMTPRAQEVATVTWAVLVIENNQMYAYIPSSENEGANGNGFAGKVELDMNAVYNGTTLSLEELEAIHGQVLQFKAVILKTSDGASGAPRRVAVDDNAPASSNYTLGVLELIGANNGVVTPIEEVIAAGKVVKDVKFYNLQGVAKAESWQGVNIIVRTFDDGTRDSRKVVF
ncbi:MAG: hypothetical protein IJ632_00540 [Muribaculaceae bacterium]|nr:hypothetical protein [Muribaculaceae bacterium]